MSAGDFTFTSSPTTGGKESTTKARTTGISSPSPVSTKALCYGATDHSKFNIDGAKTASDNLCSGRHTLSPGNTLGYVEETAVNGLKVYAQVKWSDAQEGCKPKKNYVVDEKTCQEMLKSISSDCKSWPMSIKQVQSTTSLTSTSFLGPSKGGKKVDDSDDGCVLFTLGAPKMDQS